MRSATERALPAGLMQASVTGVVVARDMLGEACT